MSRLHLAALCLLLALGACRIEDHTPTGSRRDEDAIQHLLTLYARRLSARDWAGVRALFWGEGSYAGSLGPDAPAHRELVVPIDSAITSLEHALDGAPADAYQVRVLRTDLRQEGDLAAAWLTIRRRAPVGGAEAERDCMEHVVLRRLAGEWRILSVASSQ